MRVTHTMTVYQLAFMPRLFPVNCYFIEEEQELTLIDAALPYSKKAILDAARRIGKPITRIVLTHAHEDHVGALDGLKQDLPEAQVYISVRDAKLLSGDRSLESGEPQTPIRGSVPKKLITRADILLHDNDRIGSLLALSAPGHTPGSMVFVDTRNNAMIAGDAFQSRGGLAVSGQLNPFFPFPAWATWSKQTALASARRLQQYKPTLLATGHGPMISEPGAAMERAIASASHTFSQDK
ncbi:MBL fold metallo-hydrolase [Paenibacillaceae bacterium]|nr:MBL fold metallo-hydrolase [Paenibacillaceae bacterium]